MLPFHPNSDVNIPAITRRYNLEIATPLIATPLIATPLIQYVHSRQQSVILRAATVLQYD